MTNIELRDQLRALAEKATAGPWQIKSDWTPEDFRTIIGNVDGETHADGSTTVDYTCVARCMDEFEEPGNASDAALIVALRNNLPAILDALEAASPAKEG